jgi:(p)ppGpp synthase/HD superfamily hydrolase
MTETVDRHAVEKAIGFLADMIRASGNNPKPVILHSVRVGVLLIDSGHGTDTVIAGILHDIVEDSAATLDDVRTRFGDTVASLVEANTFDPSMDRKKRDRDTLTRCKRAGHAALVVKAADILENWEFFSSVGPNAIDELFLKKTRTFLETTHDTMDREPIWRKLERRHAEMMLGIPDSTSDGGAV